MSSDDPTTPTSRPSRDRCDEIEIPRSEPHLKLELISETRMLAPVRGLIDALARRVGFDDIDASHLSLAVDEVLANVIKHGYERNPDGRIFLRVWCLDGDRPRESSSAGPAVSHQVVAGSAPGVMVVVEDHGKQVDPSCFRSRDLDDLRPGGLGVHIIREVTDGCRFEPRSGPGMRAILVKWLPTSGIESGGIESGPNQTQSKAERP